MTLSEEFAEAFAKRDWMGAFIIAMFFVIWLPFKLFFALIHSIFPFLKFVADEAKVIREEHQGSPKIEGLLATRELRGAITTPELKDPEDIFANLIETADPTPSREIIRALVDFFNELYDLQELAKIPQAPPPCSPDSIEAIRYRDALRLHIARFRDTDAIQVIYMYTLYEIVRALMKRVPPSHHLGDEDERPAQFTVPLHTLITDPTLITEFCEVCNEEKAIELHLFLKIRKRIEENKKLIEDKKLKLSTFEETMEAYLKGTPFLPLLKAQVGFEIPDKVRSLHAFCCAGSGHGKTMLLGADLYHNLQREDKPTCIIIDSQDDLIPKLERLEILQDRLVILDPRDAPQLNMFALPQRYHTYTLEQREQLEREIADMYGFIFAAKENPLTERQQVALSYVVKLMFLIPGSNIHTLREFIDLDAKSLNKTKYPEYIRQMPTNSQAFFDNQFFTGNYTITRQGISGRLHSILQNPAFERMFGATDNKLDLFKEIEAGKCIVVNTTKTYLGASASTVFGRWLLTNAISCAFQRKDLPKPYRQVLIYVDEAKEYYEHGGETLDDLFTQVRKWEYCMWINTQQTDQLGKAKSTVLSNTAIKFAGGTSVADAKTLAPELRTTAETLLSLKRQKLSSEFACYISGHTPRAVTLEVPFLVIENAPTISKEAHKALRQRNRERYGTLSSANVNHENSLSQTHEAPAKKASNEVPPLQPTTVSTTTPPPTPTPATDPHAGIDD